MGLGEKGFNIAIIKMFKDLGGIMNIIWKEKGIKKNQLEILELKNALSEI